MPQEPLSVRKAAVLGAGVMGAQIAAHLANARVPTLLFDLPAAEGSENAAAERALAALAVQKPAPLADSRAAGYIRPANYDDHLAELSGCDLVIEAVAERADVKAAVYARAVPHLGSHTLLASNTSGLSLAALAAPFPAALKRRFCGVHFFNPPRYMHLVELVPTADTAPEHLDRLERFLTAVLGKGVVRAKDTPNFIGNRIGIFSLLSALHHAAAFGLPFDVADDLTGSRLGRAKSATFRTIDVVGLDTFAHVAETMRTALPDDPWHHCFSLPEWFRCLMADGALGAKTGAGIFRKENGRIMVLNPAAGSYAPAVGQAAPEVAAILQEPDTHRRLAALRACPHPQAQFVWALFRDLFHYTAVHAAGIADTARDIDFALRWGFGWAQGPLEIWQAAGVRQATQWIRGDTAAGKTMSGAPLPDWLDGTEAFHTDAGSLNFSARRYEPRSGLDVYRRQYLPAPLLGESRRELGETVLETEAVRAFTLDGRILVLDIRSPAGAFGTAVSDGICRALDEAEARFDALVLWTSEAPFSAAAPTDSLAAVLAEGGTAAVEAVLKRIQDTAVRLRRSRVPTVAAVQGAVLGHGCTWAMYCRRTVAALESRIGLTETALGLIPAGGCAEAVLRNAQNGGGLAGLTAHYRRILLGTVADSALAAQESGCLKPEDTVVFHARELLHAALDEARALAAADSLPQPPRRFPAAGRAGAAALAECLDGMKAQGLISAHRESVGRRLALVMSGGGAEAGTPTDEAQLLDLERRVFLELLQTEETQACIKSPP